MRLLNRAKILSQCPRVNEKLFHLWVIFLRTWSLKTLILCETIRAGYRQIWKILCWLFSTSKICIIKERIYAWTSVFVIVIFVCSCYMSWCYTFSILPTFRCVKSLWIFLPSAKVLETIRISKVIKGLCADIAGIVFIKNYRLIFRHSGCCKIIRLKLRDKKWYSYNQEE